MALHPGKSKCMVLGTIPRLKSLGNINLTINGTLLDNVSVQKILGIYVDNTIKWHIQIDDVCKKMNSKLALFRRIAYYLSDDMKRLFYQAYILPITDYCCIVWGKDNKGYINKIHKLQKRIAKIVLGKHIKYHNENIFKELNWLSHYDRCKYHASVLVYKTIYKMFPQYMSDLLSISNNKMHSLRSINNKDIVLPHHVRTNYMKDTFLFYSMNIWNKIPPSIRSSVNLKLFKQKYKEYLQTYPDKQFY